MKLLLHTCCAPCLIYPLERLKEKGFEVTALFYNPNIHPFAEYKNRKQAIEELLGDGSRPKAEVSPKEGHSKIEFRTVPIIYPEYRPQEFFRAVNLKETNGRCSLCWSLRLKATAKTAKEKGFTHFSTTLLVSPYQDQELLKEIGSNIAKDEGTDFYYEDFRAGFREAHNQARAQGIYCQKYCGCIYSEIERCMKSEKH